jgi:NADPH:quinone reductase-like Zn-dependent oxidoreductase
LPNIFRVFLLKSDGDKLSTWIRKRDRAVEDVREAVHGYTGDRGVSAVFDPIGASTYETSLQLLAPLGCLTNYGELSGRAPAMNLHEVQRDALGRRCS